MDDYDPACPTEDDLPSLDLSQVPLPPSKPQPRHSPPPPMPERKSKKKKKKKHRNGGRRAHDVEEEGGGNDEAETYGAHGGSGDRDAHAETEVPVRALDQTSEGISAPDPSVESAVSEYQAPSTKQHMTRSAASATTSSPKPLQFKMKMDVDSGKTKVSFHLRKSLRKNPLKASEEEEEGDEKGEEGKELKNKEDLEKRAAGEYMPTRFKVSKKHEMFRPDLLPVGGVSVVFNSSEIGSTAANTADVNIPSLLSLPVGMPAVLPDSVSPKDDRVSGVLESETSAAEASKTASLPEEKEKLEEKDKETEKFEEKEEKVKERNDEKEESTGRERRSKRIDARNTKEEEEKKENGEKKPEEKHSFSSRVRRNKDEESVGHLDKEKDIKDESYTERSRSSRSSRRKRNEEIDNKEDDTKSSPKRESRRRRRDEETDDKNDKESSPVRESSRNEKNGKDSEKIHGTKERRGSRKSEEKDKDTLDESERDRKKYEQEEKDHSRRSARRRRRSDSEGRELSRSPDRKDRTESGKDRSRRSDRLEKEERKDKESSDRSSRRSKKGERENESSYSSDRRTRNGRRRSRSRSRDKRNKSTSPEISTEKPDRSDSSAKSHSADKGKEIEMEKQGDKKKLGKIVLRRSTESNDFEVAESSTPSEAKESKNVDVDVSSKEINEREKKKDASPTFEESSKAETGEHKGGGKAVSKDCAFEDESDISGTHPKESLKKRESEKVHKNNHSSDDEKIGNRKDEHVERGRSRSSRRKRNEADEEKEEKRSPKEKILSSRHGSIDIDDKKEKKKKTKSKDVEETNRIKEKKEKAKDVNETTHLKEKREKLKDIAETTLVKEEDLKAKEEDLKSKPYYNPNLEPALPADQVLVDISALPGKSRWELEEEEEASGGMFQSRRGQWKRSRFHSQPFTMTQMALAAPGGRRSFTSATGRGKEDVVVVGPISSLPLMGEHGSSNEEDLEGQQHKKHKEKKKKNKTKGEKKSKKKKKKHEAPEEDQVKIAQPVHRSEESSSNMKSTKEKILEKKRTPTADVTKSESSKFGGTSKIVDYLKGYSEKMVSVTEIENSSTKQSDHSKSDAQIVEARKEEKDEDFMKTLEKKENDSASSEKLTSAEDSNGDKSRKSQEVIEVSEKKVDVDITSIKDEQDDKGAKLDEEVDAEQIVADERVSLSRDSGALDRKDRKNEEVRERAKSIEKERSRSMEKEKISGSSERKNKSSSRSPLRETKEKSRSPSSDRKTNTRKDKSRSGTPAEAKSKSKKKRSRSRSRSSERTCQSKQRKSRSLSSERKGRGRHERSESVSSDRKRNDRKVKSRSSSSERKTKGRRRRSKSRSLSSERRRQRRGKSKSPSQERRKRGKRGKSRSLSSERKSWSRRGRSRSVSLERKRSRVRKRQSPSKSRSRSRDRSYRRKHSPDSIRSARERKRSESQDRWGRRRRRSDSRERPAQDRSRRSASMERGTKNGPSNIKVKRRSSSEEPTVREPEKTPDISMPTIDLSSIPVPSEIPLPGEEIKMDNARKQKEEMEKTGTEIKTKSKKASMPQIEVSCDKKDSVPTEKGTNAGDNYEDTPMEFSDDEDASSTKGSQKVQNTERTSGMNSPQLSLSYASVGEKTEKVAVKKSTLGSGKERQIKFSISGSSKRMRPVVVKSLLDDEPEESVKSSSPLLKEKHSSLNVLDKANEENGLMQKPSTEMPEGSVSVDTAEKKPKEDIDTKSEKTECAVIATKEKAYIDADSAEKILLKKSKADTDLTSLTSEDKADNEEEEEKEKKLHSGISPPPEKPKDPKPSPHKLKFRYTPLWAMEDDQEPPVSSEKKEKMEEGKTTINLGLDYGSESSDGEEASSSPVKKNSLQLSKELASPASDAPVEMTKETSSEEEKEADLQKETSADSGGSPEVNQKAVSGTGPEERSPELYSPTQYEEDSEEAYSPSHPSVSDIDLLTPSGSEASVNKTFKSGTTKAEPKASTMPQIQTSLLFPITGLHNKQAPIPSLPPFLPAQAGLGPQLVPSLPQAVFPTFPSQGSINPQPVPPPVAAPQGIPAPVVYPQGISIPQAPPGLQGVPAPISAQGAPLAPIPMQANAPTIPQGAYAPVAPPQISAPSRVSAPIAEPQIIPAPGPIPSLQGAHVPLLVAAPQNIPMPQGIPAPVPAPHILPSSIPVQQHAPKPDPSYSQTFEGLHSSSILGTLPMPGLNPIPPLPVPHPATVTNSSTTFQPPVPTVPTDPVDDPSVHLLMSNIPSNEHTSSQLSSSAVISQGVKQASKTKLGPSKRPRFSSILSQPKIEDTKTLGSFGLKTSMAVETNQENQTKEKSKTQVSEKSTVHTDKSEKGISQITSKTSETIERTADMKESEVENPNKAHIEVSNNTKRAPVLDVPDKIPSKSSTEETSKESMKTKNVEEVAKISGDAKNENVILLSKSVPLLEESGANESKEEPSPGIFGQEMIIDTASIPLPGAPPVKTPSKSDISRDPTPTLDVAETGKNTAIAVLGTQQPDGSATSSLVPPPPSFPTNVSSSTTSHLPKRSLTESFPAPPSTSKNSMTESFPASPGSASSGSTPTSSTTVSPKSQTLGALLAERKKRFGQSPLAIGLLPKPAIQSPLSIGPLPKVPPEPVPSASKQRKSGESEKDLQEKNQNQSRIHFVFKAKPVMQKTVVPGFEEDDASDDEEESRGTGQLSELKAASMPEESSTPPPPPPPFPVGLSSSQVVPTVVSEGESIPRVGVSREIQEPEPSQNLETYPVQVISGSREGKGRPEVSDYLRTEIIESGRDTAERRQREIVKDRERYKENERHKDRSESDRSKKRSQEDDEYDRDKEKETRRKDDTTIEDWTDKTIKKEKEDDGEYGKSSSRQEKRKNSDGRDRREKEHRREDDNDRDSRRKREEKSRDKRQNSSERDDEEHYRRRSRDDDRKRRKYDEDRRDRRRDRSRERNRSRDHSRDRDRGSRADSRDRDRRREDSRERGRRERSRDRSGHSKHSKRDKSLSPDGRWSSERSRRDRSRSRSRSPSRERERHRRSIEGKSSVSSSSSHKKDSKSFKEELLEEFQKLDSTKISTSASQELYKVPASGHSYSEENLTHYQPSDGHSYPPVSQNYPPEQTGYGAESGMYPVYQSSSSDSMIYPNQDSGYPVPEQTYQGPGASNPHGLDPNYPPEHHYPASAYYPPGQYEPSSMPPQPAVEPSYPQEEHHQYSVYPQPPSVYPPGPQYHNQPPPVQQAEFHQHFPQPQQQMTPYQAPQAPVTPTFSAPHSGNFHNTPLPLQPHTSHAFSQNAQPAFPSPPTFTPCPPLGPRAPLLPHNARAPLLKTPLLPCPVSSSDNSRPLSSLATNSGNLSEVPRQRKSLTTSSSNKPSGSSPLIKPVVSSSESPSVDSSTSKPSTSRATSSRSLREPSFENSSLAEPNTEQQQQQQTARPEGSKQRQSKAERKKSSKVVEEVNEATVSSTGVEDSTGDTGSDSGTDSSQKPLKVKSRWRRTSEAEAVVDTSTPPSATTSSTPMPLAKQVLNRVASAAGSPGSSPTPDSSPREMRRTRSRARAETSGSSTDTPPPPPPSKKIKVDDDDEEKDEEKPKEEDREASDDKENTAAEEEEEEEVDLDALRLRPDFPKFEIISENIHLKERRRNKSMKRMQCDCTTSREDRAMGIEACGSDCLNRMLMIECGSRCPCGDHCTNKGFQKKQYAKAIPFTAGNKGWGLKAGKDFDEKGTFIMEYVGELLDYDEFVRRTHQYAKQGLRHHYFMALNADEVVDATLRGSISRFINHSCDPNCETQKWTVNGELRVGFFTRKEIQKGEELTFDYQFEHYGEAQKCYCGAENCRGQIGIVKGSPQKSPPRNNKKKDKKKKEEIFTDEMLETDIQRLSVLEGLQNKNHVLELCRLMVRADKVQHRMAILQILQDTTETKCLRLFLDYHGLSLFWSWMTDIGASDHSKDSEELRMLILSVLKDLPIPNKNMVKESKVLDVVERWALAAVAAARKPPPPPPTGTACQEPDFLEGDQTADVPGEDSILWDPTEADSASDLGADEEMTEVSTPSFLHQAPEVLSESNGVTPVSILAPAAKDGKRTKRRVTFAEVPVDAEFSPEPHEHGDEEEEEGEGISSTQGEEGVSDESETSQQQSGVADSTSNQPAQQGEEEDNPDDVSATMAYVSQSPLVQLATQLLTQWAELKEVFKIPKKERVEERKRTERELDVLSKKEPTNSTSDPYAKWKSTKVRTYRKKSVDDEDKKASQQPKISKEERRQQFEAQVKAEDEMAAQAFAEEQQRQQEEFELHQKRLMEDPHYFYFHQRQQELIAAAGGDPNLIPSESLLMGQPEVLIDPATGQPVIDPVTGQPLMQQVDPATGQPVAMDTQVDPVTGQVLGYEGQAPPHIDPHTGQPVQHIDPHTGQPVQHIDPHTGQPVPHIDPHTGQPMQHVDPHMGQPMQHVDPHMGQPMQQMDQLTGQPAPHIDPHTGQLLQVDPHIGQPIPHIDPHMGQPIPHIDPHTGQPVLPHIDPHTGQPILPHIDPHTGQMMEAHHPGQPPLVDPVTGQPVQIPHHLGQMAPGIAPHQTVSPIPGVITTPAPTPSVAVSEPEFEEEVPPPPSPPTVPVVKLPPNWKTAKDAEGRVYYYHAFTRQTQWDMPSWEENEGDDSDNDMDLDPMPNPEEVIRSKRKTMMAAADTSSEVARKIKEQFRSKMSGFIVTYLNPFRKQDCKIGRITSTEDFKRLARKLTHHVMSKELKHCRHVEDLEVNENVKAKAKDYVRKYMSKFGSHYEDKKATSSPMDDTGL